MAGINGSGVLAGKVAVITGASRGIGEAIAIRYAMEGAKVVVSARTLAEGDHILPGSITGVADRINQAGGEATAVRCDLSQADDRAALIRTTEDVYGPVDILVNNAAVSWFMPVDGFPDKRLRLMFEVQAFAPFHLAQLVLPSMRERRSGWILNISSHAAIHPNVDSGSIGETVYGMVKAALERFTTGLAAETRDDNIGVNAISPGLVATPGVLHLGLVTDANRDTVTSVEEIAEACLRLSYGDASKLSGLITYDADILTEFNLSPAQLLA